MIPYYPDVQVISTPTEVGLITSLRKEHEGTWYIWTVKRIWDSTEGLPNFEQTNKFHRDVYYSLILGRYSPGIKVNGEYFFPKSETQQSEEERLSESFVTNER